ncbi:MAG: hypothetical protein WCF18_11175, partial [Chthoniobacteraceae bacterium]
RQSGDGAWRSTHYGAFRDGDALTPVVLWALAGSDSPAIDRGRRWLDRLTSAQAARNEPWNGLAYPLFTASYSAQFFAACGDSGRAGFWAEVVAQLRSREELGWLADDPACGAWSDSPVLPRLIDHTLPPPDMVAPNLSATVLGVQALVAAGRRAEAAAALSFVEQCQNFSEVKAGAFDDGGFIFAPGDPIRNKAGVAGSDSADRTRFRSYGSATCDGYLALRACGLTKDHARVRAAAAWLQHRGDGEWAEGRSAARESLYFYHAQARAAVLADLADRPRARSLADELIARQASDGSWQGCASASCEDDPALATAFAARALSF